MIKDLFIKDIEDIYLTHEQDSEKDLKVCLSVRVPLEPEDKEPCGTVELEWKIVLDKLPDPRFRKIAVMGPGQQLLVSYFVFVFHFYGISKLFTYHMNKVFTTDLVNLLTKMGPAILRQIRLLGQQQGHC